MPEQQTRKTSEAAQTAKPSKLTQSAQSAETGKLTQSAETGKLTQSAGKLTQSAETGKLTQSAETGKLTQSAETGELVATGQRRYVPNYAPKEMILDRGEGARFWDLDGNEYVDLGAGISVTSLGHGDPELAEALSAQAGRLWHVSNLYFAEPVVRLAEELCEASFRRPGVLLQLRRRGERGRHQARPQAREPEPRR